MVGRRREHSDRSWGGLSRVPGDGSLPSGHRAREQRATGSSLPPREWRDGKPARAAARWRSQENGQQGSHTAARLGAIVGAADAGGSGIAAALDLQERAEVGGRVEAPGPPGQPLDGGGTTARDGLQLAREPQKPSRGTTHPDRDAQFEHINHKVEQSLAQQQTGDLGGYQEEGTDR